MTGIRLGYGTYGMGREDVLEAIPRLAAMGYRALELTIAPGWPTAPGLLDAAARVRLARAIQGAGFSPPVLMLLAQPFADCDGPDEIGRHLHEACRLAADLNFETDWPIVTTTLGGKIPDWASGRDRIAQTCASMAAIAEEYGVILALEPHAGGNFNTPEKAVWLMDTVGHPNLRLNCDISHFLAQGTDVSRALAQMIPFTVYAHVKDVEAPGHPPQFVLPGAGAFSWLAYFVELLQMGYAGQVVVEVSGQIWGAPGYDPWRVAQFCYTALNLALMAAELTFDRPPEVRSRWAAATHQV